MTQISRDDVLSLARLSSLQLQPDEVDGLSKDINRIIEYFGQLSELNTDDVEPTYQVNDLQNVWRDDIAVPSISSDVLLSIAPEQHLHQIKVPKVL